MVDYAFVPLAFIAGALISGVACILALTISWRAEYQKRLIELGAAHYDPQTGAFVEKPTGEGK